MYIGQDVCVPVLDFSGPSIECSDGVFDMEPGNKKQEETVIIT